jgi:ABC-2 type transport system ATP-binding protein
MISFFYFIHLNNIILIILNIVNVLTSMDKKNILSVKNLEKIYSSKETSATKALNNLNLDVKEGEIFGLLGPNGAGKTTFINILAGTVIKTSGQVNVWGFDLDKNSRQVRASIGIVPQEVNLDPFFSPRKLLELQAGLYGIKKKDRITDTILKLVSLEKQADSYARSLSGGMKRRLLMAKALVHQPPIIFLDEPTAGVDVELRKNLWENVRLLNRQGVTILLTTHYLEEAEEMCDRIAILNKGNLVALDSTKNLLDKIQTKKVIIKTDKKININDDDLDSLKIISNLENEVCMSYEKSKINMGELIALIKKNNVQIIDISTDDGDLEDVFLRLIKN